MPVKQATDSLPLSEPVYLILVSLAEGPRHGYGVLKDVAEVSGGRVMLSTGTLYGALKRMLAAGWITRSDGKGTGEETAYPGKDRKEYTLTSAGRHLLIAEIARLSRLTRIARERLVVEGSDV